MGDRKGDFEKFQNSIVFKDLLALVVIFSNIPRKQSKRINEAEPITLVSTSKFEVETRVDDCKVKIFINQCEFDILIKDSVLNIEKRSLKSTK